MDETVLLTAETAMLHIDDETVDHGANQIQKQSNHKASNSTTSSQQSLTTPPTSAHPNPQPNTTAIAAQGDEYELGQAIGFGSTAIVYAGRNTRTGESVAIKVFDLDRFEQPQIDRLRQELAVMTAAKAHENLLSHRTCFTRANELWVVMPLCGMGSVADILKWQSMGLPQPTGLEEPVIACILAQTVAALHHLHTTGHCHRDVKAANLLLDMDGTVRLADFGVSASLGVATQSDAAVKRKTFVGTPCWMAPEVMEGGAYDGEKADIWSLGILALELAYGQAPYAKYPPMKVIYLTLSAPNPPALEPEKCHFKYSKTLKDFVQTCLQRDPEKRPTAEALLRHPLIRSAKKAPLLVDRLVMRCPPITARNTQTQTASGGGMEHSSSSHSEDKAPAVEWDFSDSERREGTVSRKGRFLVHQLTGECLAKAAECVVKATNDCLAKADCLARAEGRQPETVKTLEKMLADQPTGSTIKKGRFSVESNGAGAGCGNHPVNGSDQVNQPQRSRVSIPAGQFEQLCLLVEMLKEHIDAISADQHLPQGPPMSSSSGQHRRSSTSLGNNTKRESTDAATCTGYAEM